MRLAHNIKNKLKLIFVPFAFEINFEWNRYETKLIDPPTRCCYFFRIEHHHRRRLHRDCLNETQYWIRFTTQFICLRLFGSCVSRTILNLSHLWHSDKSDTRCGTAINKRYLLWEKTLAKKKTKKWAETFVHIGNNNEDGRYIQYSIPYTYHTYTYDIRRYTKSTANGPKHSHQTT